MTSDQLSMFEGEGEAPDKPSKAKPINLSVSRTITAPAEKIFDRWLIPVFVGDWMFGSHLGRETVLDLQNEVRPGGGFNYKIQRDGQELICCGEYQLIDRPKRLKFSWQENQSAAINITVSFDQLEDKTRLKIALQLDQSLGDQAETIKQQWAARCKCLAEKLSR